MAMSPSTPSMGGRNRRSLRGLLQVGAAATALLACLPYLAEPAFAQAVDRAAADQEVAAGARQALSRARAAQQRSDLRTAQIELRNAVRADPNSGYLRFELASISLDIGDTDTAEKEARAALERNYNLAGSTQLILRSLLARGRYAAILREHPLPTDPTASRALVAQIGAARVAASLANNDRPGARTELAALQAAAPNEPETHLATAQMAAVDNNRAEVAAGIERALAVAPNHQDALLRKAGLQLSENDRTGAVATLDRLLERSPNAVAARVLRGELLMRDGQVDKAREDVEAALRVAPANSSAIFLRALLQTRAQEWRAADETLSRLGPTLANFPDGFLVQATVKRQIGQAEQALDLAQRHVSRRPDDPRGAKLLALMEMEKRQPAAAAGTLERLVQRGVADAETYDLLSRALMQSGRPRDAAAAIEKALEAVPNDPGLRTRLAAARLASGDTGGALEAAQQALRANANQPGARELLVIAALARGEITLADEEYAKLSPESKRTELGSIADASLKVARLDIAGGRAALDDVLRRFPESAGARLGLARLDARSGDADAAMRRWIEVAERDPSNLEALNGLAVTVAAGGPRAAPALAALEAAHAKAPSAPAPALTLANVLMRTGQAERALAVLDEPSLRTGPLQRGAALHLLRADANAILQRWPEMEAAARTAFADEPDSPLTRRQLALAMARNGDARGAEELVRAGLRRRPADGLLQRTLVALVQQSRGLDAALEVADELAKQRDALPGAASLRGELLLAAQRPADAARAFAAAYAADPSSALAVRTAAAWQLAGDRNQATATLESWLQRAPRDVPALALMAQFDLQAGRNDAAERRLAVVLEQAPSDAVSLNNLAWTLALRGGEANLSRARGLAERAYFISPSAETADTLGWVLVRSGDAARGLPLLREAVAMRRIANAAQAGTAIDAVDAGIAYRLAVALNATGDRAEARRVLEPVLASGSAFPERGEAERLMASLRSGG